MTFAAVPALLAKNPRNAFVTQIGQRDAIALQTLCEKMTQSLANSS
jgi:hypothetical protein